MRDRGFLDLFVNEKPIIAMLHLKGNSDEDVFKRVQRELAIYVRNQVDAVIVEDYFGTYHHMEMALSYLKEQYPKMICGVNCLNVDAMGFELAMKYHTDFVQFDSVVGHVKPWDEEAIGAFFDLYRSRYQGKVLGGVRFKYQPVLSVNNVAEDLKIAMQRCDAICVTQDATGQETSMAKIEEFRNNIGSFPLIVGAGVTPDNMAKQFAIADGAIVGSYLKDTCHDDGEVDEEHVKKIIEQVRKIRGEKNDQTN